MTDDEIKELGKEILGINECSKENAERNTCNCDLNKCSLGTLLEGFVTGYKTAIKTIYKNT